MTSIREFFILLEQARHAKYELKMLWKERRAYLLGSYRTILKLDGDCRIADDIRMMKRRGVIGSAKRC